MSKTSGLSFSEADEEGRGKPQRRKDAEVKAGGREDELLGERSDELMETVKEKGKETFERGKAVMERVAETALDEAQKQGLTVEAADEKLSELAGKAGEVAKKAKEEAKSAAEEQKLAPQQLKSEVAEASGSTTSQSKSVNLPPKGASHQGDF